jgi:hypothetical protein
MPSDRIDGPEHPFQSARIITECVPVFGPDNPHRMPPAQSKARPLAVAEGEDGVRDFSIARGQLIRTDTQDHQFDDEIVFTRMQQAGAHIGAAGLDQAILDAMIR